MMIREQDEAENILRIAKRFGNKKRAYLLINALQGKHIPCSPSASLNMMLDFGKKLEKIYPTTKLVIGFAETATAIGAAVSYCFADDCVYVHTTREEVDGVEQWIEFLEEHSHAAEQKLCADYLQAWLKQTDTVIFVDDELSTGKTLINMIAQLKEKFPLLHEKKLVAASIFNRVSVENERRMEMAGIESAYLYKLPNVDYTSMVDPIMVWEGEYPKKKKHIFSHQTLGEAFQQNPRKGVHIQRYVMDCQGFAKKVCEKIPIEIKPQSKILVLGTEECMFSALVLGQSLENQYPDITVKCHATTRSPIGICTQKEYPITSGIKLESFYEKERHTYIYNLAAYDTVLILSDTTSQNLSALEDLASALEGYGCQKIYYIQGGYHVWNI